MKIKLKEGAKMPTKAYPTDAGWDLYALADNFLWPNLRLGYDDETQTTIWEYQHCNLVNTGVSIAIPEGFYGQIAEKSGLALKGIGVVGGIIDSGFSGEIQVMVINRTSKTIEIDEGDKIAQLIIQPISTEGLELVTELDDTDRGNSGWGSSGVN